MSHGDGHQACKLALFNPCRVCARDHTTKSRATTATLMLCSGRNLIFAIYDLLNQLPAAGAAKLEFGTQGRRCVFPFMDITFVVKLCAAHREQVAGAPHSVCVCNQNDSSRIPFASVAKCKICKFSLEVMQKEGGCTRNAKNSIKFSRAKAESGAPFLHSRATLGDFAFSQRGKS
jgi:hypothetical protein